MNDDSRNISHTKKEIFLKSLAQYGNVTKAAEECGYSRRYLYQLRESDPEFAQAWDDAKEAYADWLEQVASERATRAEKPSDLLLMFRLKGERPHKYRDNVQVHHHVDLFAHMDIRHLISIAQKAVEPTQIKTIEPELVEHQPETEEPFQSGSVETMHIKEDKGHE